MFAKICAIIVLSTLSEAKIKDPEKYCEKDYQCYTKKEIYNKPDLLNVVCLTKCKPSPQCGKDFEFWPISNEDRKFVVDLHNELRSKVARGKQIGLNGESLPPAADMREFVYDEELEGIAQCHSTFCQPASHVELLKHMACKRSSKFSGVGDCLTYNAFNDKSKINAKDVLKQAIYGFYNESRLFTRQHIKNFNLVYNSGNFMQMGHFSEMIWSTVTSVGCGFSYFRSTSPPQNFPPEYTHLVYIICNYAPMGNTMGESEVYKIGSPASNCPKGWAPDETRGLCVNKHPGPRQKITSISVPNINNYCKFNCEVEGSSNTDNLVCIRKNMNCGPDNRCGPDFEFVLLENKEKHFILDSFNTFRSKLAQGKNQQNSPISDMKKLSYSEELEKLAQCRAATCEDDFSENSCIKNLKNQNVRQIMWIEHSPQNMGESSEIEPQDYLNRSLDRFNKFEYFHSGNSDQSSIWYLSKLFPSNYEEIGCGIVYFSKLPNELTSNPEDDEKTFVMYMVCLLAPAGDNIWETNVNKFGKPASNCPAGWSGNPSTGLCVKGNYY